VPRASVTQAADDLKHRDALLRGFPEVESVIGKSGRADTPTDPAPLDMVETFVNFRPKELWPKRVLKFNDAVRQTRDVLAGLERRGYVLRAPREADRDDLINIATMKALERFDETMRTLALLRYREIERDLSPVLTRFAVRETVRRFLEADYLEWPPGVNAEAEVNRLVEELTPEHGPWLAKNPALEEVARLCQEVARRLHAVRAPNNPKVQALANPSEALALREAFLQDIVNDVSELLGAAPKSFAGEVLRAVEKQRLLFWHERV